MKHGANVGKREAGAASDREAENGQQQCIGSRER
jgi:hypothetical protein